MNFDISLLPAQAEFISDTTTPNLLLCGGFGSGKSRAGALKAVILALANPGCDGIIASPTIGLAKRSIVKQVQEVLAELNIKHQFNKSELIFKIDCGRGKVSEIHVLSAENWVRLVGMNAAYFVFDEVDTMKADDAREAWVKLTGRVRAGTVRQMCATTTPEGFKFCHDFFVREPSEKPSLRDQRRLIRARTVDNPWLPDEYIQSLKEAYSPELLRAYLNGEFVNLKQSTVYCNYDRELSDTKLTIGDLPHGRPLMIGCDFNYGGMSAIVIGQFGAPTIDIYGRRQEGKDEVTAVIDEVLGSKNTTELIVALKERYPDRNVIICPDASGGQQRSSAAGVTDISLLQSAGYELRFNPSNPRVKDRVNSVNARFLNGLGARRLLVNSSRCPILARCLQQQTYSQDGQPNKGAKVGADTSLMIDGPVDALGYAIYQFWPLAGGPQIRVS
jgi:hypothetical protein